MKDLLAKELHGETAKKYGLKDNKRDGALMAQNADWRNSNARAIETDSKLASGQLDHKNRMY